MGYVENGQIATSILVGSSLPYIDAMRPQPIRAQHITLKPLTRSAYTVCGN